jgi:opacity protein-like surface antigen
MRRTLLATLIIACAATAGAQSLITTTRQPSHNEGIFEIGPRISNYSTDVRESLTPLRTGRQSSFGVVGGYRNGTFVLDFMYDHDPENGISVASLIVDTGNYSRDRGEVTVGFAAAPFLDLQGGVRIDSTRIGGVVILGNPVATDMNIDHQALTAGIRFHTEPNPVGFFLVGRGLIGSAKLDFGEGNVDTDTTGYRGEAGLNIRIGDSMWTVQPGYEYDHFETKDFGVRMNTNRFFLNFVYRSR